MQILSFFIILFSLVALGAFLLLLCCITYIIMSFESHVLMKNGKANCCLLVSFSYLKLYILCEIQKNY